MARPPILFPAFLLLAASCTGTASPPEPPPVTTRFAQVACSLPPRILERVRNGTHHTRSGEIQMALKPENAFSYAHAGPWDYLQDVPILFYGPGHVPAVGRVDRPVRMPDVAPTLAEFLGYRFRALDGRTMSEALLPPDRRGDPPRLILVVVWDGGGDNVLETWPDSWPTVRGLIPKGAWFENATLGTSPSITPPVHTTLGTGAYPRRHGLVSLELRVDGRLVPSHGRGPQYLLVPTLADLYDRDMGNVPEVGMVAFRDWHLGMIGQGSYFRGGDRDLAVLLEEGTGRWTLPPPNDRYFEFPSYVNQVPGLEEATRRLDLEDGRLDGVWLGQRVFDDLGLWRRTPAYAEWQTRVLEEVIRREGFGKDDTPDLLFTNYKQIDEVGHNWSLSSRQMEAVVGSSDQAVADLIEVLDTEVGRGQWVLMLTADHGVIPNPKMSGGTLLRKEEFKTDVVRAFDRDGDDRVVLEKFRPTELWIDLDELRENGFNLRQVADFLMKYTKEDNLARPERLSAVEREESVFAAAFPTRLLSRLPCQN